MTIIHVARLHEVLIAAGVMVGGVDSNGIVSPPELQSAAQPYIDTFDDSEAAAATWVAQKFKTAAAELIDYGGQQRGEAMDRVIRALVVRLQAVIVAHARCLSDINAAAQAATNLADFKTLMAAISYPPQPTLGQVIAALKSDVALTPE